MIRVHMASDHPALLATVSREDLLGWNPGRIVGWATDGGASASSPSPVPMISLSSLPR